SGSGRTKRWRLQRRSPPEIGEDPMGWKERYMAPRRGLIGRFATAAFALLATGLILAMARPAGAAFLETGEYGYGFMTWQAASDFNTWLRVAGTSLYVPGLLGVATAASGSITSEVEAGTWPGLAASPL